MHLNENLCVGADSITNSLNQFDCLQLLAPRKFIKTCTKRIELERMVAFLNHTFGRVMEFLWRAFDRIPAIRIGLDLISHRATQELVDRLPEHLPHNIPAGHFNRRDGRHCNLAGTRVVVQVHPSHQVFDIDGIMTQDMVWYGFRKIPQQRIGMVEHAYLAHSFQSVVGDDTHESQIAPRGSHDSTFHIDNFHSTLTSACGYSGNVRSFEGMLTCSATGMASPAAPGRDCKASG